VSGISNTGVNWAVNGLAPGDPNTTFGTITTSGLYTSPTAIPNPATFNVTATSQADATQVANAQVTVQAGGPAQNQTSQVAPVKMGTSGGNVNDTSTGFCCSGTLGSLVTFDGKTDFVLSNNHVLARSGKGVNGEAIGQP